MLAKGYVEPGILTNLPYEDNSFDLVFSADVLEHIHPEEADIVISELIRVSRRHIFMSISLKVCASRLLRHRWCHSGLRRRTRARTRADDVPTHDSVRVHAVQSMVRLTVGLWVVVTPPAGPHQGDSGQRR